MADDIKDPVETEEPKTGAEVAEPEEEEVSDVEDRTKDFSKYVKVATQLDELFDAVIQGFEDKQEQSEDIDRFWDVYNCVLNENQAYFGNSQVYVSAVADAVDALTTRDNNMLFPVNGRYASAIGPSGTVPYDLIALLDHYVRQTKMRENIVPCLLRTGKVTGHYILGVGWKETTLHTIKKKTTATIEDDQGVPIEGAEEVDDIEEEEITMGMPTLEVKDPRDVCLLPATVDNVSDCTIVAERLHMSKSAVEDAIADGTFEEEPGKELLENFSSRTTGNEIDTAKKALDNVGIKTNGKGSKTAIIYRVWSTIKLKGKQKRLCVSYFGGNKIKLACKRNPYWNDRIPLLAQPARKMANAVAGKSIISKVEDLQYALNDATNMGLDSAQYSLCPITATDPAKNPRTGSMVLSMGALWEVDPNSTKFMEFPQLWKEAFSMARSLMDQIMQSMGINPALLPHGNAGKKPSQAQIAQEQQVAQETTADNIAILEEGIFNGLLAWFHDLDYQFRDKKIAVRQFGQLGAQAKMQEVEPFKTYTAYSFRWYGTEGTKAVQAVQQQISAMNVLAKIPPEQLNGRKLDIGPIIDQIAEVAFGPRVAPYVLIDQRHQLSMNPMEENDLLLHDFPVTVQAMDDDVAHLKAHMEAVKMHVGLDSQAKELFKLHILAHINQMNAKSQASAGGKPPQGQPGVGAAPGGPRPGAQAGPPKPMQQPAGAIHQDQMVDPNRMPR